MADSIISEASIKRYVLFASETCVQDSLLASGITTSEDFKHLKVKHGIEISCRSKKRKKTVRGRTVVSISPYGFQELVTAASISKQWDPNLIEEHWVHTIEENLVIQRLVFSAKAGPLLRNREFVVFERRELLNDGTFVIAIASLPHEMAAAIVPKSGKRVRGLIQSGWVIEHFEPNGECLVTCTTQIDPGGWLPKWITDVLSINLVMVMEDLCKAAGSTNRYVLSQQV